jgi:UDP-glucose 4-epimerase
MNVLVTGGAGFIGSHTVVALHEAGFCPVILDNFSNSNPEAVKGIEKIIGKSPILYQNDCNDVDQLRQIFEAEKIEGIIHFAAFKAVGESMQKPVAYYQNNLGSLLTLLQVMQEKKVPNLIFSSSCTVYGEPALLPVTEDTPVKTANSVYGNTKQIGEEMLRDAVHAQLGIKAISLRYFNPIGAHPSAHIGELPLGTPFNLVPYITQTAAGLREKLNVHGGDYDTEDGTCVRDYIHVMDLAEAHVSALKHLVSVEKRDFYEVFNVGTGRGASVLDLIKTFEEISGKPLPYQIGPRRDGDIVAVYADVKKSGERLDWQASRSMKTALEDAWRWQLALG